MQAVLARLSELRDERSLWDAAAESPYAVTIRQRLAELSPQTRRSRARRRGYVGAGFSVALHFVILVQLANVLLPEEAPKILSQLQALLTNKPDEPEPLDAELELADPSDEQADSVWTANANAIGPELAEELPDIEQVVDKTEAPDIEVDIPPVQEIAAAQLSEVVVKRGTIGDSVVEVAGAVDRITHEIATSLEQSKVLVVWLMDSSISLADDREEVAKRLERVYREVDEVGSLRGDSLLGAVVAYGAQWQELVAPTSDGKLIVQGIRAVPVDESGLENVFTAVMSSVDKYRALKSRDKRKIMVVIWTDESGDDDSQLEPALRELQRLAVPAYVVGPSSMFGRTMGTHAYKHPEDGKTYDIPVNRGPDTVRRELLRVPYWFDGDQYESLRAGMGPYALTRLTQETGGAYFVSEAAADRSPFSLATMRPYLPDYSSAQEYVRSASSSQLRRAILQAVEVTHQRELRGTPQLSFAPTGENFQQELREAQQTVAFNSLILDQALAFFGPKGMEKEYLEEQSVRWRAWYDLTYGRLLAMRVRTNEYNWACAVMRGKGSEFVDKQSNRWTFRPDEKINFGSAAERTAKEATRLLQRAIDQNPGTPWAVLAKRELAYPLGFRVDEDYVAPPPPPKPDLTPNNNQPMGRVEEQPRMLERPKEVVLPKL